MYFSAAEESYIRALHVLVTSALLIFRFLFLLSFFLNSCLCLDLYLTVNSPFSPAHKRMKYYLLYSFLLTALFIGADYLEAHWTNEAEEGELILVIFAYLVFIIVSTVTTIFAARRILRPGVSQQVRSQVVSRHIKYILMIAISFSLYMFVILQSDLLGKETNSNFRLVADLLFSS